MIRKRFLLECPLIVALIVGVIWYANRPWPPPGKRLIRNSAGWALIDAEHPLPSVAPAEQLTWDGGR